MLPLYDPDMAYISYNTELLQYGLHIGNTASTMNLMLEKLVQCKYSLHCIYLL